MSPARPKAGAGALALALASLVAGYGLRGAPPEPDPAVRVVAVAAPKPYEPAGPPRLPEPRPARVWVLQADRPGRAVAADFGPDGRWHYDWPSSRPYELSAGFASVVDRGERRLCVRPASGK